MQNYLRGKHYFDIELKAWTKTSTVVRLDDDANPILLYDNIMMSSSD